MSDQPETLAAILAEMRGNEFDDPHLDADGIIGARRLARDWADRIEAAAERERNAHTNDIHDALYKATGIPGNAAALREALQNLCDCTSCDWSCIERTGFDPLNEFCLHCTGRPERDDDCPWKMARAAIASPARNCDRFTDGDTASNAYEDEGGEKDYLDFARWLFAPAEGGAE